MDKTTEILFLAIFSSDHDQCHWPPPFIQTLVSLTQFHPLYPKVHVWCQNKKWWPKQFIINKSIKWVIFCLYHLIYDIIHFSHLVQCKIKLNLQILLFTPSFTVFFGQKWLIPPIADMLYASLIYRRQIKSAMIFPAVRFSTLSKWLLFFQCEPVQCWVISKTSLRLETFSLMEFSKKEIE